MAFADYLAFSNAFYTSSGNMLSSYILTKFNYFYFIIYLKACPNFKGAPRILHKLLAIFSALSGFNI